MRHRPKRSYLVPQSDSKHRGQTWLLRGQVPGEECERTYLRPDEQFRLSYDLTPHGELINHSTQLTLEDGEYKFVLTEVDGYEGLHLLICENRLTPGPLQTKEQITNAWEEAHESKFPITHDDLAASICVYGAGSLVVCDNKLLRISNNSGHYKPSLENMLYFLSLVGSKLNPGLRQCIEIEDHARVGKGIICVYKLLSLVNRRTVKYAFLDDQNNQALLRSYAQHEKTAVFRLIEKQEIAAGRKTWLMPDGYVGTQQFPTSAFFRSIDLARKSPPTQVADSPDGYSDAASFEKVTKTLNLINPRRLISKQVAKPTARGTIKAADKAHQTGSLRPLKCNLAKYFARENSDTKNNDDTENTRAQPTCTA